MAFSEVIGHEQVISRLETLLSLKGGAFLFHGSPCIGKRTVAYAMSKSLLCLGTPTCESCRMFSRGHPDFLCVGTESRVKVADADLVIEFSKTKSMISRCKVIVIDNAETMTIEAGNRFLKVMEDMTEGFFFFLISSDPSRLLPTIRSRCLPYKFDTPKPEVFMNILWKKMGHEMQQARILGWLAAGGFSDILSKAGVYLKCRDRAWDFLQTVRNKDVIQCLDTVDSMDEDEAKLFMMMLMLVMNDLALIKKVVPINKDLEDDMKRQADKFKDKALVVAVGLLLSIESGLIYNINVKTHLKNALIKMHPVLNA